MKDLILTLGHNASAIFVNEGNIVCGYEEERLSGIKSDSNYPIAAINHIMVTNKIDEFDRVFISHWFASTQLQDCKYLDVDHVQAIGKRVYSLSDSFTHHDAHHMSALWFARSHGFPKRATSFVIDGFGSFGECISVYDVNGEESNLIFRSHGYSKSLGLLYQYATAFLGMKMHADEYKLLGYEAHINELDFEEESFLNGQAHDYSKQLLTSIVDPLKINKDTDPVVNKNALAEVQNDLTTRLRSICSELEYEDVSSRHTRIAIAHFVQAVVENVVFELMNKFKPQNVILSGGVFMNVKLNHIINQVTPGRVCVMPLAGDQGAGLGVRYHFDKNLKWPGHLFWCKRKLHNYLLKDVDGIKVTNAIKAPNEIADAINEDGFVNVVHGDMEFGARALGHTTTFGLPTVDVLHRINETNDRSTIMPMAPIMTESQAEKYLENFELTKIVGSHHYMVMAIGVQPQRVSEIKGAAHGYVTGEYTARPQVIDDKTSVAYRVLKRFDHPLINTSFNYHGVPIVFNTNQIIDSHKAQRMNNPNVKTIVISEDV